MNLKELSLYELAKITTDITDKNMILPFADMQFGYDVSVNGNGIFCIETNNGFIYKEEMIHFITEKVIKNKSSSFILIKSNKSLYEEIKTLGKNISFSCNVYANNYALLKDNLKETINILKKNQDDLSTHIKNLEILLSN